MAPRITRAELEERARAADAHATIATKVALALYRREAPDAEETFHNRYGDVVRLTLYCSTGAEGGLVIVDPDDGSIPYLTTLDGLIRACPASDYDFHDALHRLHVKRCAICRGAS